MRLLGSNNKPCAALPRDSNFQEIFQEMNGLAVEDYAKESDTCGALARFTFRSPITNIVAITFVSLSEDCSNAIMVLHMYAQWLPADSGMSSPLNGPFSDASSLGGNVGAFAKEIGIIGSRPFGSVAKAEQKRIIESLDAMLRFYAWAQSPNVYEKQMYSPPTISPCIPTVFVDSDAAIEATRCPLTRKKLHEKFVNPYD